MKILEGTEYNQAVEWMDAATEVAKKSTCQRAQCGSVIIQNGRIIGQGFNSPAGGEHHRCNDTYQIPQHNKHDLTCCVHAEVRAIHDALLKSPEQLKGSTIYLMRLSSEGHQSKAGMPYCTVCSKEALDAGISYFVLWHEDGIGLYDTKEFNDLSYQYFKE